MKYERKTEDEYELLYDYGFGKEVLSRYSTLREARADRKAYIENEGICPEIKHRLIPKKKEAK